jgi:hypothetical protein
MSLKKAVKPINLCRITAPMKMLEHLARFISQTSYFRCGETEKLSLHVLMLLTNSTCCSGVKTHRYLPIYSDTVLSVLYTALDVVCGAPNYLDAFKCLIKPLMTALTTFVIDSRDQLCRLVGLFSSQTI